MYKIISVSNRHLCDDFIERVKIITDMGIDVILREKDLNENDYKKLALSVMSPQIIMHTYVKAAKELSCRRIHLPMNIFENSDISGFDTIGVSIHSVEEALEAQNRGATYITAGHIFETDCKRGVPPRGIQFLKNIVESVSIPVYAIGGINPKNAKEAFDAGAAGVCIMSGLMQCKNIKNYLMNFK